MKYIFEYKSYYNVGDKIILEYWYNDMICVCEITELIGRKYKITHNIPESIIKNAPDEIITAADIIDHYRPKKASK